MKVSFNKNEIVLTKNEVCKSAVYKIVESPVNPREGLEVGRTVALLRRAGNLDFVVLTELGECYILSGMGQEWRFVFVRDIEEIIFL